MQTYSDTRNNIFLNKSSYFCKQLNSQQLYCVKNLMSNTSDTIVNLYHVYLSFEIGTVK